MTALKQKPGKVLRVNPSTWKLIESERGKKETIAAAVHRLISGVRPQRKLYVLPSDLSESLAEARGRAVLKAVKKKETPEKPIAVKVES